MNSQHLVRYLHFALSLFVLLLILLLANSVREEQKANPFNTGGDLIPSSYEEEPASRGETGVIPGNPGDRLPFERYLSSSASAGTCMIASRPCEIALIPGLGAVAGPDVLVAKSRVYLPIIEYSTQSDMSIGCYKNEVTQQLGQLFVNDPGQQRARETLQCSDRLVAAAQARVWNMAQNNYLSHTDPKGRSPHFYIRQTDYPLPDAYASGENFVESIAGGFASANSAWKALLGSPSHRVHVLGEKDFFRAQNCFGIGYIESTDHLRHYYVILTAPCSNRQVEEGLVSQAEDDLGYAR